MITCDRCKKQINICRRNGIFNAHGDRVENGDLCNDCYKELVDILERVDKEFEKEREEKFNFEFLNWMGSFKETLSKLSK